LQPNVAPALVESLWVVPNTAVEAAQASVQHLQVSNSVGAPTRDFHIAREGLDSEHVQLESLEGVGEYLRTLAIVGARIQDVSLRSWGGRL
jgi:hypothetical protein